MKVLVAGAGAIGQFVGGRLHGAGHDVTLLTTPRHVAAFAAKGLCVRGHSSHCWSPHAVASAAQAGGGFGAILLTCKAYLTAELGAQAAPLLAPDGVLVSLQNGLGNGQKLARIVPPHRIALALTSHGVTVEEPGLLRHAGEGATLVGPGPGATPDAAHAALRLLEDAALRPEWHDDMRGPVWRKAIVNHAVNPVAALHGLRNGALLEHLELLPLSDALMDESLALAARAQARLPPGDLHAALRTTLGATRDNKVSMLQDVEARRPTEIEAITGRMVRLGKRLEVAMPRSQAVYGQVKQLESSYLGAAAAQRMAQGEMAWETEPF